VISKPPRARDAGAARGRDGALAADTSAANQYRSRRGPEGRGRGGRSRRESGPRAGLRGYACAVASSYRSHAHHRRPAATAGAVASSYRSQAHRSNRPPLQRFPICGRTSARSAALNVPSGGTRRAPAHVPDSLTSAMCTGARSVPWSRASARANAASCSLSGDARAVLTQFSALFRHVGWFRRPPSARPWRHADSPRLPTDAAPLGSASVELLHCFRSSRPVRGAWQLAVAGHALGRGRAARAAARADGDRRVRRWPPRARLTPALDATLQVRRTTRLVHVSACVPRSWRIHLGRISAAARFGADGGMTASKARRPSRSSRLAAATCSSYARGHVSCSRPARTRARRDAAAAGLAMALTLSRADALAAASVPAARPPTLERHRARVA
jgi:hypothetical protein